MEIEIPLSDHKLFLKNVPSEECVIVMPGTQVVRALTCRVVRMIGNGTLGDALPCRIHPDVPNAIVTTCQAGSNTYVIT